MTSASERLVAAGSERGARRRRGRRSGGHSALRIARAAVFAVALALVAGVVPAAPGAPTRTRPPGPADLPARTVASAADWVRTPRALPVTHVRTWHRIQMAPDPGGGLYVLVALWEEESDGRTSRSILTHLDARGRTTAGWPLSAADWYCHNEAMGTWDPSPSLLTARDGSVRVVCAAGSWLADHIDRVRVFAFDGRARPLPGWPVDLEHYDVNQAPRMVDTRFVSVAVDYASASYGRWLQSIAADGSRTIGVRPDGSDPSWSDLSTIGPDGAAYLLDWRHGSSTEVTAVDVKGVRAGWPVTIRYPVGGVVFGPPGLVFLVTERGGGVRTQLRLLTSGGMPVATAATLLPIEWLSAWQGAGPGEPVALIAPDRTAWVFGTRDRNATWQMGTRDATTLVYALDPSGRVRRGWPRDISPGLRPLGSCEGPVTGCGFWYSRPAIGPGNVLYLTRESASSSTGGSILAIGIDGQDRPGWPVTLRRAGSWFEPIAVGGTGTVFALAHEPEKGGSSATVLAITPDGKVRWRRTVVEP